ncbi:MAG: tripartite tricarboxylate transporter permease [Chloroflexi bacterium]|nr:tripartite tricarboxylate transporter permease [Chloroflexota bacterium]
MLEPIAEAVAYLLVPSYWGAVFVAVSLALMASVIPGVNAVLVMALAMAIVLFNVDDPALGIVLLATITGVNNTLDSIPAILYGLPGAATQVTFLEGHQLARQGKAAHTLGAVYSVSALGGIIGAALLMLAIPVVRPFVLKFGFSEIGATALVGLGMVSVLSRGAMGKGLAMAMLGLLLGMIGRDPMDGFSRLTIGPIFRMELVPVALGLFALPEMFDLTISRRPVAPVGATFSNRQVFEGAREGLRHWKMVIRQSVFGVFLGAIPGVGSAVIDWLAYAFGIFFSKDKTQFGKGSLEGVMFAESAQNAKEGGQAIPTLAMGVPGGVPWVLVMVAMIAYGIAPGPEMLGANAHITILLVITLAVANLMVTGLGLLITGQLAKLTTIPYPVIGGIIIPITLLSSFVDTTNWRGVQTLLAMGAVGLAMKHFGWPRPPMLLAFILAPIIERNLRNGISVHGVGGVLTDGLTMTIVAIAVATTLLFLRAMRKLDDEEGEQAKRVMHVAELETGLLPTSSTPSHEPTSVPASTEKSPLWMRWHWEYLFHAALIIVTVAWLWDARTYPEGGWRVPVVLSGGVLAITLLEVMKVAVGRSQQTSIMDLGMTSAGIEGASRAAVRLLALLVLFVLIGVTLHLAYAALVLAATIPLVMLKGLGKWPIAAITAGIVFLFTTVVLDNILFMIWPEPFVTGWDVHWGILLPSFGF